MLNNHTKSEPGLHENEKVVISPMGSCKWMLLLFKTIENKGKENE